MAAEQKELERHSGLTTTLLGCHGCRYGDRTKPAHCEAEVGRLRALKAEDPSAHWLDNPSFLLMAEP